MDMPSTVGGWATLVAAVTTILMLWSGALAGVAKLWIGDIVRRSVDKGMGPVQLELKAMNGELARVRLIEQKIENGLASDVAELKSGQVRIEDRVDRIVEHMAWDGTTERRE